MKAPYFMKISFEAQQPEYKGVLRGGWIKISPNARIGLPCSVWAYVKWWYRLWIWLTLTIGGRKYWEYRLGRRNK